MMKGELSGKILTEFVALRTKMCTYRKLGKNVKILVLKRYKEVCSPQKIYS